MAFSEHGSHEHDFYYSGAMDESFNIEMLTFSSNIEMTSV